MRKSTLVARLGALVIASAMLASAGPARAADPGPDTQPLNVVAIEGNDAEDQAEALTKALRNAVRASGGWSLSPGDYSMEVLVLSMKCADPPDATCQAKIADEIKVDRYIWGYLKKLKNGNVGGELALWVRGKGTTKTPIEYGANLTEANDDSLKRVANEAFNKLTGGSPKGGIHVKAGAEGGQLFIDGEPIGALNNGEATLQIPSGAHTLAVKAPGYDDSQTQVVIKPGKTSDVALTLVKAAPEIDHQRARDRRHRHDRRRRRGGRSRRGGRDHPGLEQLGRAADRCGLQDRVGRDAEEHPGLRQRQGVRERDGDEAPSHQDGSTE